MQLLVVMSARVCVCWVNCLTHVWTLIVKRRWRERWGTKHTQTHTHAHMPLARQTPWFRVPGRAWGLVGVCVCVFHLDGGNKNCTTFRIWVCWVIARRTKQHVILAGDTSAADIMRLSHVGCFRIDCEIHSATRAAEELAVAVLFGGNHWWYTKLLTVRYWVFSDILLDKMYVYMTANLHRSLDMLFC